MPQCRMAGVVSYVAAADAAQVTRARARSAHLIRRRPQHRPGCRKAGVGRYIAAADAAELTRGRARRAHVHSGYRKYAARVRPSG
jgi:hypothetical protein